MNCKKIYNLQKIENKYVICPDKYKIDNNYICRREDVPSICTKKINNKSVCNPIAYNTIGENHWANKIEGQPINIGKPIKNGKFIRNKINTKNFNDKKEIGNLPTFKVVINNNKKATGETVDKISNIKKDECKENCDENSACNSWEWHKKKRDCFLKDAKRSSLILHN